MQDQRRGGTETKGRPLGYPPLTIAAAKGDLRGAKALIDAGADVNEKSADGITPIYFASAFNRLDVLDLLLKHGAETNCLTVDGDTPALIARVKGFVEVTRALGAVRRAGQG